MKKYKIGFTLMETLMVIAILAVLCGVGLPAYKLVISKIHAEIEIANLYRAIQYARSEAIKSNIITTVCASSDRQHCIGKWQDGCLVLSEQRVLKYFPMLDSGAQIIWKSFPKRSYLQMSPQGFTDNQNGTFYYTSGDKKINVSLIISKTGRIRVENN